MGLHRVDRFSAINLLTRPLNGSMARRTAKPAGEPTLGRVTGIKLLSLPSLPISSRTIHFDSKTSSVEDEKNRDGRKLIRNATR